MRKVLLVAGLAAVALSGCSSLGNYEEQANLVQLDSSTYRLSLHQPWMKQEVRVREAAHEDATNVCAQRGQGMLPLSSTTEGPSAEKTGASVEYTFRCVGFMAAPEGANVFRRLGFYTSEEGRLQAEKELEEELANTK